MVSRSPPDSLFVDTIYSDYMKPAPHLTIPGPTFFDDDAVSRHFAQHRLWHRTFQCNIIIPSISLKEGDNILETGTGPGVWILETAKELPSSIHFFGTDIVSNIFPLDHADNIHFSVASSTCLPTTWEGFFQFVHQRFSISSLKITEWPIALNEIYRVLAPGGWVQLSEPGPGHAGPALEQLKLLAGHLFQVHGFHLDCGLHLERMLTQAGFSYVYTEKQTLPISKWEGPDGKIGRDDLIDIYRAMKTPLLKAGGFGVIKTEEEFEALLADVSKELEEIEGAETIWIVSYAQKL